MLAHDNPELLSRDHDNFPRLHLLVRRLGEEGEYGLLILYNTYVRFQCSSIERTAVICILLTNHAKQTLARYHIRNASTIRITMQYYQFFDALNTSSKTILFSIYI
jgi:hypothetical protein